MNKVYVYHYYALKTSCGVTTHLDGIVNVDALLLNYDDYTSLKSSIREDDLGADLTICSLTLLGESCVEEMSPQ